MYGADSTVTGNELREVPGFHAELESKMKMNWTMVMNHRVPTMIRLMISTMRNLGFSTRCSVLKTLTSDSVLWRYCPLAVVFGEMNKGHPLLVDCAYNTLWNTTKLEVIR